MATILETRYTQEYILDFARRKATLVDTVRRDTIDHGGALVFLIAGDGGAEVVTRGAFGKIPPADDNQTEVTVSLNEDISLVEKTRFNIFTARASSQQTALMRTNNMGKVHRSQDRRVINAIATGTQTLGAIATMDKQTANKIAVTLANADVGTEDDGNNIFAAVTNAAWAELTDIASFASADYVHFGSESPVEAGLNMPGRFKNWMGINWTTHNGLPGKGTSAATCLAWHRNAVGYAMSTNGIDAQIGYDGKEDTTWARTTIFHGAVKLINAGIVKWTHDDTGVLA